MWEGMTPRLEEFLQWIDYDGDGQLVPLNFTRQGSGACVHVEEYASMSYGRCYALLFSCPFQARKTVYLNLDLAALERTRLVLYFHHPRARSGLSHELWPAPVAQGAVKGGGWGSFELSKHVSLQFATTTEEEFFDCMDESVKMDLEDLARQNRICYFPVFAGLLSAVPGLAEKLPYCSNVSLYKDSFITLYRLLADHAFSRESCSPPERETTWELSSKGGLTPLLEGGRAQAYVFLSSASVSVRREHRLMDLPALSSAVGGVVGMFLGWSFRDLADAAAKSFPA